MIAPMTEKYATPNIKGISEVMTAITDDTVIAFEILPFGLNIFSAANTSISSVKIAVINGPKFAYPNGTKSKYEYV